MPCAPRNRIPPLTCYTQESSRYLTTENDPAEPKITILGFVFSTRVNWGILPLIARNTINTWRYDRGRKGYCSALIKSTLTYPEYLWLPVENLSAHVKAAGRDTNDCNVAKLQIAARYTTTDNHTN